MVVGGVGGCPISPPPPPPVVRLTPFPMPPPPLCSIGLIFAFSCTISVLCRFVSVCHWAVFLVGGPTRSRSEITVSSVSTAPPPPPPILPSNRLAAASMAPEPAIRPPATAVVTPPFSVPPPEAPPCPLISTPLAPMPVPSLVLEWSTAIGGGSLPPQTKVTVGKPPPDQSENEICRWENLGQGRARPQTRG